MVPSTPEDRPGLPDGTIVREAARILLLDPRDRVLLLRFADPVTGVLLWVTPGGGLEPGETHAQAAVRELVEETGLQVARLGPCVGEQASRFTWNGQDYHQLDRFYAARIDETPELTRAGLEVGEILVRAAWWGGEELAALTDAVEPADLADLLALAAARMPGTP